MSVTKLQSWKLNLRENETKTSGWNLIELSEK